MKTFFLQYIGSFLFLILLGSCLSPVPEINNQSELETFIQDEMEDQNIAALSMLIFEEDQVLFENTFGQAQIAENITLDKDHLFLIASISKVVTATALLQLFDQNLFSLDDEINDYLPFEVSVPNKNTPITFKMLLCHTSGIADGSSLDDQYYVGQDSPVELRYFLDNYLVEGGEFYDENENFHNFEPGSKHEYSNEGSALIAVLVEQISNMNFNSYCKKYIFEPLEMSNTYWSLDEILMADKVIVQPYEYTNNEHQEIAHYTFTDYPNGGLRTTAHDLFKFLSTFLTDKTVNDFQSLDQGTFEAMITPQIPSIDSEVGLHLFLMDSELDLWGHNGGEKGVSTIMAFNENNKNGVIIFSNHSDANLDQLLTQAYKYGLTL